jgi:hypothetical protein
VEGTLLAEMRDIVERLTNARMISARAPNEPLRIPWSL